MRVGVGFGKFTLAVDFEAVRLESLRAAAPVVGRQLANRGRAIVGEFVRGVGDGVHDVARSLSTRKAKR
jgi:hypothetical protein